MATRQWHQSAFMLHAQHKKGIVNIKTANLLQSLADDFLFHVNFELITIRPVRRLKFLISLITA